MLLLCKKMKAQELKERISCLLFEEFLALEVIHMKFGFLSKIFSNKIVYVAPFLSCRLSRSALCCFRVLFLLLEFISCNL